MLHLLATLYADDTTRTALVDLLKIFNVDGIVVAIIHLAGGIVYEDWSVSFP